METIKKKGLFVALAFVFSMLMFVFTFNIKAEENQSCKTVDDKEVCIVKNVTYKLITEVPTTIDVTVNGVEETLNLSDVTDTNPFAGYSRVINEKTWFDKVTDSEQTYTVTIDSQSPGRLSDISSSVTLDATFNVVATDNQKPVLAFSIDKTGKAYTSALSAVLALVKEEAIYFTDGAKLGSDFAFEIDALCENPSKDDLAAWISGNKNLGNNGDYATTGSVAGSHIWRADGNKIIAPRVNSIKYPAQNTDPFSPNPTKNVNPYFYAVGGYDLATANNAGNPGLTVVNGILANGTGYSGFLLTNVKQFSNTFVNSTLEVIPQGEWDLTKAGTYSYDVEITNAAGAKSTYTDFQIIVKEPEMKDITINFEDESGKAIKTDEKISEKVSCLTKKITQNGAAKVPSGETKDCEFTFAIPEITNYTFKEAKDLEGASVVGTDVKGLVKDINNFTLVYELKDAEKTALIDLYNDGDFVVRKAVEVCPSGAEVALSDIVTIDNKPYDLAGITKDAEFSGDVAKILKKLELTCEDAEKTINVYPVWSGEVKLDLNGGKLDGETEFTYYLGVETDLPTPTKDDHKFLGWSIDNTRSSYITKIDKDGIGNPVTLKANWEKIDNGTNGENGNSGNENGGDGTNELHKIPETGTNYMIIGLIALASGTIFYGIRKIRL